MTIFNKALLFVFCFFSSVVLYGQVPGVIDSLKNELLKTNTAKSKVDLLDKLSRILMNENLQEAEKYGTQLLEIAEESRDRELMVRAYISNGTRCSYWAVNRDYTNRAIEFYQKAEELAKKSRLDNYEVTALINLASIHLLIPDKIKATEYAGKASSKISIMDNDSLKILVLQTQGDVNMANNAKIEALRFYLSALRISEQISNNLLIRQCYLKLSTFYTGIEEHNRAIDYYSLAFKKLDGMKDGNIPYLRVTDVNSLGNLYAAKKNYDLAIKYYERSLRMADSLKFSNLKIPGYISLLNVYITMDQPQKAYDFMQSNPGQKLQVFLSDFQLASVIDQAYAVIFSELGNLDSAKIYFDKSAPFFERSNNVFFKMNYYLQTASYHKKAGENNKAINLFLQVNTMAEKNGQLEIMGKACKQLDTLYSRTGDYKLSSHYNSMYHLYKDSLQKTNKEKELAQVEAQDEQDRQLKAVAAAVEQKRQRNNIQYLGITIGIVALFVILVLFGMFKVRAVTIKMIGFFAFLMFFEFIFLIFKKNIYSVTKGEPWMDLLFMIGLAAILLPLHHWLEHKVLQYLTSHNRLTLAGSLFRNKFFGKRKPGKA